METNPFRASRPRPRKGRAGGSRGGPGDDPGDQQGQGEPGGRRAPGSGPSPSPRVRRWLEEALRGKVWWYRFPLLLVLAWLFLGYAGDPDHTTLFYGLTLGFHEMGHAFFSWFGHRILTAAGGTIFQLAVPLAAALYLLLAQRDPFGGTVGTFWLGTALVDAGRYAADARAQALPLVSPFGPVDPGSHDWTVLLMKFGVLSRDQAIGGALHDLGMVTMVASLGAGAWILRLMATTKPRAEMPDEP